MRDQLRHLVELVRALRDRLAEMDRELAALARKQPAARLSSAIPGSGPVTATVPPRAASRSGTTAMVAATGAIGHFRSGRHLAAHLGLLPEQHGSGGEACPGAISRRGNGYPRTLPMHGARAVLRIAATRSEDGWLGRLLQRRPVDIVVAAQAGKTARMAWAVPSQPEGHQRVPAAAGCAASRRWLRKMMRLMVTTSAPDPPSR